jgi:D-sedoheptulose 7-phosphate isomerase
VSTLETHVQQLRDALGIVEAELPRLRRWGEVVAARLLAGGRLLACGNGGSAAQAQHLTAELVGRYHDERPPLSAIALHAETSALTAIVNDYGPDEAFARQVRAHGRRHDVLVALSTSGHSSNVLAAAGAAAESGVTVLAFTGEGPNPLAAAADDALCIPGTTPTVQELHLLAVHLLCEAIDDVVLGRERTAQQLIDLEPEVRGVR